MRTEIAKRRKERFSTSSDDLGWLPPPSDCQAEPSQARAVTDGLSHTGAGDTIDFRAAHLHTHTHIIRIWCAVVHSYERQAGMKDHYRQERAWKVSKV